MQYQIEPEKYEAEQKPPDTKDIYCDSIYMKF